MEVEFHPAAEQELDAATLRYEQRREGLGEGLLDEVQDVCALISEYPDIARQVDETHRGISLRRFPFVLFYRVQGQRFT